MRLPDSNYKKRTQKDYSLSLKLQIVQEIEQGLLLLTRKAVPFALIVLAPISINIILFHLFLYPQGILPGLIVFLLNIYLVKRYWHRYESLFD